MTRLTKLIGVAALVGLAFGPATADDKQAGGKDGPLMLEGGYTIVSGERDGKPLPAEEIKGSIVRFTKDEVIGTDKDKKQIFVAKYTLDTTTKPTKIVMKSTVPAAGETTGIVEKDGDTIRLAYALPGGQVPTEFKGKEKQHLFVLKNMNKGTKTGDR